MMKYILLVMTFLIAYFPAYLGYQVEYVWVGYIFTIWFALASYIPWIRSHQKIWWIALWTIAVWWLLIETIGITTCRPYGCFAYSEQLWPKILWWAPRLLLATYPPLVLWVYQYLKRTSLSWRRSRIAWGLGLMLVDLVLDPIAVWMGLRSFPWGWFWFGVPWTNFVGRIISGTVSMMILDLILWKHYKSGSYDWWLWLTMSFFVGYAVWKLVINH